MCVYVCTRYFVFVFVLIDLGELRGFTLMTMLDNWLLLKRNHIRFTRFSITRETLSEYLSQSAQRFIDALSTFFGVLGTSAASLSILELP